MIPLFQDNEEISGPVRVHLLKTILNCIYCNASVAAKYFEQIDFLNQFIELLSTNSCNFKIIHDQKLAINSISRLCSLVRTDGFVLGNRLIKLIEIALVIFEKLLELEEQIRKGSISSAAISVDKVSLDSNWDDGNLEDVPCPASPSDDENIYQLFASVINPLLQNNQVELNLLNSSQVSVLKLVLHYQ